jgi:thymidylate kinase
MISIVVEGPEDSGKSHAIALIAKYLKGLGCNAKIQGEQTHNAGTMSMDEDQLLERIQSEPIVITQMQTSESETFVYSSLLANARP